jgi:hypothetical protein
MGLLFSDKKTSLSSNSRDLYKTPCPNDREGRDRIISELNAQGHRVTGFYVEDVEEDAPRENIKPAPTRPRRSR